MFIIGFCPYVVSLLFRNRDVTMGKPGPCLGLVRSGLDLASGIQVNHQLQILQPVYVNICSGSGQLALHDFGPPHYELI